MVYVLGATGQIVFATAILAPLSYVAAATNLPMQDANLQVVDQALAHLHEVRVPGPVSGR